MTGVLSTPLAPPRRFIMLDGLRVAGAILVYLSHVISVSLLPLGLPVWLQGVGVEIFYFVTGFGIGWNILQARQWSAGRFLWQRALRILPAYYVSILVIVGLISSALLLSPHGLSIIAQHLLMVHGFSLEFRGAINGVYWMLGNIFWFYLLIALVAPLLRSRWFWVVVITGLTLNMGWRIGVFLLIPATDELGRHYWGTQLPGVMEIYWVGVACAKVCQSALHPSSSLLNRRWTAWLPVGAGVGIAYIGSVGRFSAAESLPLFVGWRLVFGVGLAVAAIGAFQLEQSPRAVQWYRYSGLNLLGKISYGFFLYHLPVIISFNKVVGGAAFTNPWLLFSVMTGAVLLMATGSYHFVERRAITINLIPLFQWRRSYPHEHAKQNQ